MSLLESRPTRPRPCCSLARGGLPSKPRQVAVPVLLILAVVGCTKDTIAPDPVVTSIVISPDTVVIASVDSSVTFRAVVYDQNGNPVSGGVIRWSTTNTGVALVNHEGALTPVGVGDATILAQIESVTGRAHVRVEPVVSEVTVFPDSTKIGSLPADLTYSATVLNQFGRMLSSDAVTWASSNPAVATIDGAGVITPVGLGQTTIRATVGDVYGEGILEIVPTVTNVVVTPDSLVFGALGDTVTLSATAFDQFGDPIPSQDFSWSVVESGVVAVDSVGTLTTTGAGWREVQARALGGNCGGTCIGFAQALVVTSRAYVSHRYAGASNPLMKIDPVLRAAVDTADVDGLGGEMAFGPSEATLYVATNPTQPGDLSVMDLMTFDVPSSTVGVGATPIYVAARPDGSEIYVGNVGSQNVAVVESASNTVTDSIDVSGLPRGVAVTPDGSELWVALGDNCPGRIDVIDTGSRVVVDSIFPGQCTGGDVAFNPEGTTAYVPDGRFDTVTIIDVATRSVTGTVTGFYAPRGAVVSPDGRRVYVTNYTTNGSVGVIETAILPNRLLTTIQLDPGQAPLKVAVSPEGAFVLVTIPDRDEVVLIDARGNSVLGVVRVGQSPFDVIFTR